MTRWCSPTSQSKVWLWMMIPLTTRRGERWLHASVTSDITTSTNAIGMWWNHSGEDLDTKHLITPELMEVLRTENIDYTAVMQLKQISIKKPSVLIGWQVRFSSIIYDCKYNFNSITSRLDYLTKLASNRSSSWLEFERTTSLRVNSGSLNRINQINGWDSVDLLIKEVRTSTHSGKVLLCLDHYYVYAY